MTIKMVALAAAMAAVSGVALASQPAPRNETSVCNRFMTTPKLRAFIGSVLQSDSYGTPYFDTSRYDTMIGPNVLQCIFEIDPPMRTVMRYDAFGNPLYGESPAGPETYVEVRINLKTGTTQKRTIDPSATWH